MYAGAQQEMATVTWYISVGVWCSLNKDLSMGRILFNHSKLQTTQTQLRGTSADNSE